jgi:beta-glucosidase
VPSPVPTNADSPDAGESLSVAAAERIASLPRSFRFGAATAAYQIEGASDVDGRTPSIWDTYSRTPGMVDHGDTGDVACDHYHRMPEDVAIMRDLGLDLYRFSVSWPRVQPRGRGPINPAGMAFYDRLVDELLAAGIEPMLTLYHWDLPQELEDAGGWPVRDTAYRFADYALAVFERLGDRVNRWTTLNEPWCAAMLGYAIGNQAPGRQNLADGIKAAHHLLLGHGLATRAIRAAASRPVELSLVLNMGAAFPVTDSVADAEAVRRAEGMGFRLYLDPVRFGRYPSDVVADLAARGIELPIADDDLEIISAPIDLLGINYYFSTWFSGVDEAGNTSDAAGNPIERQVPTGRPRTAMGWEIVPEGFTSLLLQLAKDYPGLPLMITENGAAFADEPDADGFVADHDRVAYFESHLAAVAEAVAKGAPVTGYLAWSLLDNFEWSYGYDKRFGLVRVDFDTQRRTPKLSANWFRDTIRKARGR